MARHQCGLIVLDPWDIVVAECCLNIDQPLRPGGEIFEMEFTLRNEENVGVGGDYHTYAVDTETGEQVGEEFGYGGFELEPGESQEYTVSATVADLGIEVDELVDEDDGQLVLGSIVNTDDHYELEDEIRGA